MNTLFDEIDELLSRAKYLEGKHSKTIMVPTTGCGSSPCAIGRGKLFPTF